MLLLSLSTAWLLSALTLTAAPPGPLLTGRILVKAHPGASGEALESLFAAAGARVEGVIEALGVRVVHAPPERFSLALEQLSNHPLLAFAEADVLLDPAVVPNDPYYSLAWHLPKIAAPSAWDLTQGSAAVVVAILDTGVDAAHPDLAAKLVAGWNLYDNNADTSDVAGHGTGVAGAAAASTGNGLGVAGIAWNCKLMPIRVSDPNGYASLTALAYGLTYAADHGARVANISYRASGSSTVRTAADYFRSKGGVVTVSAGNESLFDPAADNPSVITVSATDSADVVSSFSNTGNNIDLAAPGQGIMTAVKGGGFGSGTGTSFSAPVVAGVAALVISANPDLSAAQVEQILKDSADDLGTSGWDASYGAGRVNARAAVQLALATSGEGTGTGGGPADTTAPVTSVTSPVGGSVVSGTATVTVSASDDVGVARVEWYLDGTLMGSSSTAPASFSWDTRSLADGVATVSAKAFDAAGNSGSSAGVGITIQNAAPADTVSPQVAISSPAAGARLGRSTKVAVAASDNVRVSRVDLFVDGKLYASTTVLPASFTWNTSKLAKGAHSLQATAVDAAGNLARSTVVTVYK